MMRSPDPSPPPGYVTLEKVYKSGKRMNKDSEQLLYEVCRVAL